MIAGTINSNSHRLVLLLDYWLISVFIDKICNYKNCNTAVEQGPSAALNNAYGSTVFFTEALPTMFMFM